MLYIYIVKLFCLSFSLHFSELSLVGLALGGIGQFGLRGVILQWFRSYLCDRSFRVVTGSGASFLVHLVCSVPQGSVLGPRIFIMYTVDLADEQRVNLHSYVDDSQIYVHCSPSGVVSVVQQLEGCISEVCHWTSEMHPSSC